jgi:sugar phosphate isomerase/epimerase
MKLAIQENLLHGDTSIDRFRLAKELGFGAIEVWAHDINNERVLALAQAIDATGLPINGLYMGDLDGYLSPDTDGRDKAIDRFRQALADAHDLQIPNVIVTPQINRPNESVTLSPEQEKTLLIWFVRVVNDLAGAMDTALCLLPLEPSQSRALNTLGQAYAYLAEMNFHHAVRLASDFYSLQHDATPSDQMALAMPFVQNVYIHAPATRAPHAHTPELVALWTAIHAHGFNGMATLACGLPATQPHPPLDERILRQFVADVHKWVAPNE